MSPISEDGDMLWASLSILPLAYFGLNDSEIRRVERLVINPAQWPAAAVRAIRTRGEFPAAVRTGYTNHFKAGDVQAWLQEGGRRDAA